MMCLLLLLLHLLSQVLLCVLLLRQWSPLMCLPLLHLLAHLLVVVQQRWRW